MQAGRIDTLNRWHDAEVYLTEHYYRLYQMQYGIDTPHGFNAVFTCVSDNPLPDIKVITFSRDVADAIVGYKLDRRRKG